LLIKAAESCLLSGNSSFSGFPHHGNVLAFTNAVFSNLSSDSIFGVALEVGLRGSSIFKIDQVITNFSVNEW
jgi:hypothetical protein